VVSLINFCGPRAKHPSLIADLFSLRLLYLAASNSTRIADTLTSLGMKPVSE
jgi:hypothetical protein